MRAFILLLLMVCAPVAAFDKELALQQSIKVCELYHASGVLIMSMRQRGMTHAEILEETRQTFDPKVLPGIPVVINQAFQVPAYQSVGVQTIAINWFADRWESICLAERERVFGK